MGRTVEVSNLTIGMKLNSGGGPRIPLKLMSYLLDMVRGF